MVVALSLHHGARRRESCPNTQRIQRAGPRPGRLPRAGTNMALRCEATGQSFQRSSVHCAKWQRTHPHGGVRVPVPLLPALLCLKEPRPPWPCGLVKASLSSTRRPTYVLQSSHTFFSSSFSSLSFLVRNQGYAYSFTAPAGGSCRVSLGETQSYPNAC